MKHHGIRAALATFTTRSTYRIAAASATFLAVAATAGALLGPGDQPPGANEKLPIAAAEAAFGDIGGGAGAAPAAAATAEPGEPAKPADPDTAAKPAPATPAAKQPAPPAAKELRYTYEGQPNSYWCAPAATRIALSARNLLPSQGDLAGRLGTTVNGTDSAADTTRVLNDLAKTDFYRTREIPGPEATPKEMDRLQGDAVRAISSGYAIVANVVGSATLADGRWLDWPAGHYITIVGYQDEGRMVKIADPANPSVSSYWITTINMANWMGTRGYSG
ncbi:MAG TPA: C39 family peptidase [Micromonosporaceae bacterium]